MKRIPAIEQLEKQKAYRKQWYEENKKYVAEMHRMKKEEPEKYKKIVEEKKLKRTLKKLKAISFR